MVRSDDDDIHEWLFHVIKLYAIIHRVLCESHLLHILSIHIYALFIVLYLCITLKHLHDHCYLIVRLPMQTVG